MGVVIGVSGNAGGTCRKSLQKEAVYPLPLPSNPQLKPRS